MQNQQHHLVSVITPTYNSGQFIGDTIRSVVNQTYKNWELILVDDCSTDNTLSVIEQFTKTDDRVRFHRNQENMGAGETRNKGLELAKGRFISFLDADDLWHKEKLEYQLRYMLDKDVPISFTSYNLMNEKGEDLNKTIRSVPFVDYRGVLKNTIIGMSTSMIDTEIVGRDFKFIPLRTRQDLYLWISLLKRGHSAHGIEKALVSYRVRSNSISSNKYKAAKTTWYIYRHVERFSFLKSLYYFTFYAYNALKKRVLS